MQDMLFEEYEFVEKTSVRPVYGRTYLDESDRTYLDERIHPGLRERKVSTEGMVVLKRLQSELYKSGPEKDVTSLGLKGNKKKILEFIVEENQNRRIPNTNDIKNIGGLTVDNTTVDTFLRYLKGKQLIFSITIPEFVAYYGFDVLNFRRGKFSPPRPLDWLKPYLDEMRGRRGSTKSWCKKVLSPRSTYKRYWVGLVEKGGIPCYYKLGLHISIEHLRKGYQDADKD